MIRRATLLLSCLLATAAHGQNPVYKDKFLRNANPGDLAIVAEQVERLADSQRLLALVRDSTTPITRHAKCIVAIAHRDPSRANTTSFVGIELIKVFRTHASPGVIHAIRDGQWYSRDDGKALEHETVEAGTRTMGAFAALHANAATLETLTSVNGKLKLASYWHARLGAAKDADYSADEPFVRFWRVDPTTESAFRSAMPGLDKPDLPMRIENRLLSFVFTDRGNPDRMPSFNFNCNDPGLMFVAIKTYLPFSSDVGWTFLQFK